MKSNLKEKTKLKCNDSPRKEDIGKLFEFENIIDKVKVRKKMKQNVRQEKSDKAPGWFKEYAKQLNERLDESDRKEDERWAKQEKFNENILVRLDKIEKDVNNIVKKNKLKR